MIGALLVAAWPISVVRATDITSSIEASSGVEWSLSGTTITVDMSQVPPADLPASISINSSYSGTVAYAMSGSISGAFSYTNPGSVTSVFSFSNTVGPLYVTSVADISFFNAIGSYPGGQGSAALQVTAGPPGFGTTENTGGTIVIEQSGVLNVQGNGEVLNYGDPLQPTGFRLANLSAISALSYGDQSSGSNTHAGGAVSVTTGSDSVITIANSGSVLTAGISAASASGPGNTNGNYFTGAVYSGSAVTVNSYGTLTNSADTGVGIMATITGGQFLSSGTNVATNGGVLINLYASSTITLTGTNSLGVFAVSEVYTTSDPKKNTSVQAGSVTYNSQAGSLISTGSSGSTLSIGILAASAGTDLLLDPFSSQTVNGHGNGSGGVVTVSSTGNIQTQGTMSVGIAAMSLGGAGISTTNTGSAGDTAVLGNTGAASDSNGSDGDAVTVTNAGAITTLGTSAYGIVALSSGGGGLINNLLESTGTTGLVVGNDTSGGSASTGGNILVQNNGSIITGDTFGGGATSMGIVAQSIGGAGGNAGGQHPALFVGDKGGAGGKGGTVTVNTGAGSSIVTRDENSIGILAESIGGGGGNGANADGIFVAVGGRGGSGGDGGAVSVNVGGTVSTLADYSAAIMAHSIGGGGGNGGGAKSVGVGVDVGIGGKGGGGGTGGTVDASVAAGATVSTLGNVSDAFHLQSIGGGGGSGGASITEAGSVGTGEGVTLSFNLSLAGSGSTGGSGGLVTGTNAGTIQTGSVYSGTDPLAGQLSADSLGMLAQSIGGGGGSGGSAAAKSLAFSTGSAAYGSFKFDLAIGGAGSKGGSGGTVSLANLNSLTTWGDGSYGMLAQSIGGGGGYGGDSTATSAFTGKSGVGVALTMVFGGSAGAGGAGGAASVANSGSNSLIETHGQSAIGLIAQSIGGGGGSGGLGKSQLNTFATGTQSTTVIGVTLGASGGGGTGGNAGGVEASNQGTVSTAGSGAHGILAQAIAGGGGNATGGSADGSNNKITFNLALGSSGGAGGSATGTNSLGSSVAVTNTGTISTLGGDASAIIAQSIGGGGGTGGTADAEASINRTTSLSNLVFSSTGYQSNLTLGAALGGDGGGGGKGGAVLISQAGTVDTQGFQSYGILAQSISGGGGKGGSATAASNPGLFDGYDGTIQFSAQLALGGAGGDANNGSAVTVNDTGTMSTTGYGAHAIVAQSVTGGGGVGADGSADITSTIGLGLGINNTTSGTLSTSGTVTVTQAGLIATTGGDATGILAQSISGGGGIGSTGNDLKISGSLAAGVLPVHIDVTLGINLKGDFTANGGAVTINSGTVSQAATITTLGDFSHGLVAQSIGAGGGKASSIFGASSNAYADFSDTYTYVSGSTTTVSSKWITLGASEGQGSGAAATVNLLNSSITTGTSGGASSGYGAYGVLVQSIGGGGGLATIESAAANGTIALGGTGTNTGGQGGTVGYSQIGSVTTYGESAHGVVLQSIGGGGGVASVGSSDAFSGAAPAGASVNALLGSTDSFGAGQSVSGAATANIQTFGKGAIGFVAQSIGGGGGLVSSQTSGTVRLGMTSASKSASTYNGGDVSVSVENVFTEGDNAHGVVAQSIGGGGGLVNAALADGLSNTWAGSNNTALGFGGAVSVTVNKTVQTEGDGAFGIIAQSISGGGGLTDGFAGSTGGAGSTGTQSTSTVSGTVSVYQAASSQVLASGQNSTAIFAQNTSAGAYGRGNVTVTTAGFTTGGSGTNGYGVWVDGGNNTNQLNVLLGGSVTSLSNQAIHYTGSAHLNVLNQGTVQGSVSLSENGNPQGTFTNQDLFYAQGTINAIVNDSGALFIGVDSSTPSTATFTGAYTQTTGLHFLTVDVNSLSSYDQMLFAGEGAGDFNGRLKIDFYNTYHPEVGDTFTLIGAASNFYSEDFIYGVVVTGLDASVGWEAYENLDGSFDLQIVSIPEPGVVSLLALGGIALVGLARRRGALIARKRWL